MLQRPDASTAMDASELAGHEGAGGALVDPAPARERAGGELQYRASGGAHGVAPMQRLMDERRAMGGRLAARVQRKAEGGAAGSVAIPESGGSKLPGAVRAKMEPKLGADLSDVQVHTGGESAQAASGLGARAFTVGNDVHFGAGEFAPGSKEGDRLLAHELTHVVQGKKSGVQRKADEHGGGAGGAEHGGGEVSHPDEPAEKEADAVADGVTDQLHGGDDKKDAKGKDKNKKDKNKNADDAHGGGADAHGADAHGGDAHGGGAHAGGADAAHAGGAGGARGAAAEAPAEKPAPISAKFVGVGRKIFRKPPSSSSSAPSKDPASAVDPKKQAQIDQAKNCKTEADVKAICAPDPIATQKLNDVDNEQNMEVTPAKTARKGFYDAMAGWIQANGVNPTFNPATIYNQTMNNLAAPWRFQGTTIKPQNLGKAVQRTQSVGGFYGSVIDKKHYEDQFAGAPNPQKLAFEKWKEEARTGDPLQHIAKGEILPDGKSGTWFTPDSYKLTNASDAGFGQLLELAALQPEWFPDGNMVFSVDMAFAASKLIARKPTAYDGMQSALWVSRPNADTFGVTGGGANEFLGGNIPRSAIRNPKLVVPSPELQQELKAAIEAARDLALSQDPDLKKAIDTAKDDAAKKPFKDLIPNLTDMFLRGTATMPLSAHVRQMLDQIKKVTVEQRNNPSAPRAAAEIVAPSVSGAPGTGTSSASASAGSGATKSTPKKT